MLQAGYVLLNLPVIEERGYKVSIERQEIKTHTALSISQYANVIF